MWRGGKEKAAAPPPGEAAALGNRIFGLEHGLGIVVIVHGRGVDLDGGQVDVRLLDLAGGQILIGHIQRVGELHHLAGGAVQVAGDNGLQSVLLAVVANDLDVVAAGSFQHLADAQRHLIVVAEHAVQIGVGLQQVLKDLHSLDALEIGDLHVDDVDVGTLDAFLEALLAVFRAGVAGGDAAPASGGEVVVYSPNSDTEVNAVIPAFEEATGIKVILQSMGTGDVLARLEAEKANPQADVNWGAVNLAFYTEHPDLYMEYVSPNDANLPEAYQNTTGYFTNTKLSGSAALLLNLDVFEELGLDPDEFTGYKDLLRPELKGRIAMGDPTASSSAWAELTNMLLVMGDEPYDEKAWEFVGQFVEQLDGSILSSSSQIYKATADGEYAVGVSYEDPCVGLLEDGATNLKVVYPEEGAVWLPAGVAIVKGCKNEENAKKFVDFLISQDGQECSADTSIRPVLTSVENTSPNMPPFSEINVAYEDIEYCAEMQSQWQERWLELVTG